MARRQLEQRIRAIGPYLLLELLMPGGHCSRACSTCIADEWSPAGAGGGKYFRDG
jgi:hypothetical protein